MKNDQRSSGFRFLRSRKSRKLRNRFHNHCRAWETEVCNAGADDDCLSEEALGPTMVTSASRSAAGICRWKMSRLQSFPSKCVAEGDPGRNTVAEYVPLSNASIVRTSSSDAGNTTNFTPSI